MKQYTAKNIRNIALTGHGGSGKTTLAEAMLFSANATDRFGKVVDGNTVCDFDPEEIKRVTSVSTAVAPLEWQSAKINLLDAPGLFDFEGGVREALRAAECTLIAISAKSGLSVGASKAYKAAAQQNIAKMFFIGKMDSENADFYKIFDDLKALYGSAVCPIVVPHVVERKVECYVNLLTGKAYAYKGGKAAECDVPDLGGRMDDFMTALNEAAAEGSEELLEKYFSGEAFTPEEIMTGLSNGIKSGSVAPVFAGSAQELEAIDLLLNGLVGLAPSADTVYIGKDAQDNDVELAADESAPAAAVVFKTIADPFVGKLSYFKVVSGKVSPDTQMLNMRTGNNEKVSKLMTIRGKKQEDAPYVGAGDIGAVAKLQNTNTGDTLCAPNRAVTLAGISFPAPSLSMAVTPKNKGDEEKIVQGIHRLVEEDPTISFENNAETHQMVLSGLGEQHLDVISSKLKAKFGVEIILVVPKVPYRETIRKKVQVEGKHKKQTGGHGQFGHVWIEFEPCDSDDLVFEERVVGGSVPRGFFPAVEKGLRESMIKGVLARYPIVGLKATLYDGSYHPVDSSEMSFKMAASIAYRSGIPQAAPVLLEPIGLLKALVPDDVMGDIIGDINKKRGRVLGMDAAEDGYQLISAEVPIAEMHDFSTTLRSMSQGRGSFSLAFERYEDAPPMISQKIIEAAKADMEDE